MCVRVGVCKGGCKKGGGCVYGRVCVRVGGVCKEGKRVCVREEGCV